MTAAPWPIDEAWDAIVVGGGPAGSAAALVLGQAGWRVLLVERRAHVDFKFGEMISPSLHPLLVRMGLDRARLLPHHASARGNISVWGTSAPQVHDFIFNPYGDGLRLNRPLFDEQLRERAASSGAEVALGTALEDFAHESSEQGARWTVRLSSGDSSATQTTRHLVDATGRRSLIGRRLGAQRCEHDRLFAFGVISTQAHPDADPFLRIEAHEHGWFYSLQLPCGNRMVVFHTDRDLPAARQATDPAGFGELVHQTEHLAPLLAEQGFVAESRPRSAPASGARLNPCTGPGWVAVGDAALSFDPLSSEGISHALHTGFAAADALVAADRGEDSLARYEADLDATEASYQQNYRRYYSIEQRWPQAAFWTRRSGHDDRSS